MKIKLDENVPVELIGSLVARGHDVHTVQQEALSGKSDPVIFDAANREQRLLFTQDLDFSDIRRFAPGTHSGIVLIRLRDPSRRRIINRINQILELYLIEDWSRCFVVISDKKLRVRKPRN